MLSGWKLMPFPATGFLHPMMGSVWNYLLSLEIKFGLKNNFPAMGNRLFLPTPLTN
jgi:hypothetical protein